MPLLNLYGRRKWKRGNPQEYQIYNIDSMSHLGRPQNWMLSVVPFLLHIISFLLHTPSLSSWTACHLQCRSHLFTLYYTVMPYRYTKSLKLQLTEYLTQQSNVVTELQLTE
jgi:prepilin signal peptidase PulO-like enzyme (type II secretory pathway)